MAKSKFFPALATLVGTTIGAGFLSIPYVVSRSGFPIGVAYLIILASFMLLMKLYLGEVILRTKETRQLPGYAEKYLGKSAKIIMFFSMMFGIYSALLAYLIAEGQSLSYLAFGSSNHSLLFSLLFWLVLANLTYQGLRALKKYERISMFVVLSLVILVVVFFAPKIQPSNLLYIGNSPFLPLGVILFSFLAFSVLPEVKRILSTQEKLMKKVIIYGLAIPFIVYLVFTIIAVGALGQNVNEIATLSFGRFFSLLGIMTMFTAFFSLSIAVRDIFRFDFKLGRFKGWLLCSLVPLVLFLAVYFFKLASFIAILSMAGIVSFGLTGILILLMNIKAKALGNRKPEYKIPINWLIIAVLSIIFIAAVVLEILF